MIENTQERNEELEYMTEDEARMSNKSGKCEDEPEFPLAMPVETTNELC